MVVTFVLPGYAVRPLGGFAVAYEYANQLVSRGHRVTIVHPQSTASQRSLIGRHAGLVWSRGLPLIRRAISPWFALDPHVAMTFVPSLDHKFIPDADAVIATAWQTAEQVQNYPRSKGAKAYLAYDYEHWMAADSRIKSRIEATYRAPFAIIATSSTVKRLIVQRGGVVTATIFAGIDFSKFCLRVPIAERRPGSIGFPFRADPSKGTADAIDALEILRVKFGDSVEISAFGFSSARLPKWVTYQRKPSATALGDFYNRLAVFLFPSHFEGWGLPGVEAMACGAAVIAASSGGVADYARDKETAVVVPIRRPDLLAAAAAHLLEEDGYRRQLATTGHSYVQNYTWTRAASQLESVLGQIARS